jgi:hypothetical protein
MINTTPSQHHDIENSSLLGCKQGVNVSVNMHKCAMLRLPNSISRMHSQGAGCFAQSSKSVPLQNYRVRRGVNVNTWPGNPVYSAQHCIMQRKKYQRVSIRSVLFIHGCLCLLGQQNLQRSSKSSMRDALDTLLSAHLLEANHIRVVDLRMNEYLALDILVDLHA